MCRQGRNKMSPLDRGYCRWRRNIHSFIPVIKEEYDFCPERISECLSTGS